jgi:hypothetical protein
VVNPYHVEDKDFVRLQELGYLKNRPFKILIPEKVFGLSKADEEKLKQESCYETLSLLKDILDISFSTLLPEDITPEQAKILFRNLERIESFYIKAKVADILFASKKICGRDNLTVAEEAIKAYFDSANYILHKFEYSYLYASKQLERAATITLSLGKSEDILFNKLMEFFKEGKSCILIISLGEIICGIKNLSVDKINLALEEYVKIFKICNPKDTLLISGSDIWATGIKLSKKAKNLNLEHYFNKQKGDAHCGMAERFRPSPFLRIDHIKRAILCFRGVPEMKDKIEQLNKELVVSEEVEKQVQSNTGVRYCVGLNLKEPIELLEKELSVLKFEECLSKLANLCIDCLYENYDCITKTKSESPLFNRLGAKYYNDGKLVYNANSEEKNEFLNLNVLFRLIAILINEGLKIINKEHSFSPNTLFDLVKDSPFIPRDRFDFFSKGLNYFLHNEMLEAVSLLVPQIENSLRHISRRPRIIRNDLTEKEKIDIHDLFKLCVEEKVLDEKFQFYLKNILVCQPYSLRHNIAHGEINNTIGNRDSSYVACILILFLVLEPTKVLKTKCDESEKLNSMLSKIISDAIKRSLDGLSKSLWSR